jgi:hypothetical protein
VGQEVMLLLQSSPLVAQAVDHAVVDRDQLVDFGLADGTQSRREVMIANQLDAGACEIDVAVHLPRQRDARHQRGDEHSLGDEQPQWILDEQRNSGPDEEQVHGGQIGDEPRALRHTWISYFSRRR